MNTTPRDTLISARTSETIRKYNAHTIEWTADGIARAVRRCCTALIAAQNWFSKGQENIFVEYMIECALEALPDSEEAITAPLDVSARAVYEMVYDLVKQQDAMEAALRALCATARSDDVKTIEDCAGLMASKLAALPAGDDAWSALVAVAHGRGVSIDLVREEGLAAQPVVTSSAARVHKAAVKRHREAMVSAVQKQVMTTQAALRPLSAGATSTAQAAALPRSRKGGARKTAQTARSAA